LKGERKCKGSELNKEKKKKKGKIKNIEIYM
jgi:hypothetical protein